MRKFAGALPLLLLAAACSKHDPILPGVRTAIFDTPAPVMLNSEVPNLPAVANDATATECPYRLDATNTIWDGDKKIFAGFPTSNSVKAERTPVCAGGDVIAGLTTGEVVKVNPKTRKIAWIADVFRPSNMTGGASVLDIVAPIVVDGGDIFAGGLGDAYCKMGLNNGKIKWCAPIGVARPFIIAGDVSFVYATDGAMYALRNSDGAVYWRTEVASAATPEYKNGTIKIGKTKLDAATGKIL